MDLQADLKWIISELKEVKDSYLIEAFKNLLHSKKYSSGTDWWDEKEKKDISAGLKYLEMARSKSLDDVISKYP